MLLLRSDKNMEKYINKGEFEVYCERMKQPSAPTKLYHGLTLEHFLEHWQAGSIRALSRHHLDAEGKVLGTWLTDSFAYVVDNKYG